MRRKETSNSSTSTSTSYNFGYKRNPLQTACRWKLRTTSMWCELGYSIQGGVLICILVYLKEALLLDFLLARKANYGASPASLRFVASIANGNGTCRCMQVEYAGPISPYDLVQKRSNKVLWRLVRRDILCWYTCQMVWTLPQARILYVQCVGLRHKSHRDSSITCNINRQAY